MAAPALRQSASSAVRSSSAWLSNSRVGSLAEKLDQHRTESEVQSTAPAETILLAQPLRQEVLKSFPFHLGADLQVPTADKRQTHTVDPVAQPQSASADPFEGLPLKAWAERMGERIMPAYELVKEEQKKAKQAAKLSPPPEVTVPQIPHLLPFTRWASKSKDFKETFIAEDAKDRKKARLSWYHPDDTMVPRDWFKGGLLEDLKYYAPFSRRKAAAVTE